MKRLPLRPFILAALAAALLGGGYFGFRQLAGNGATPDYKFARIERGGLTASVSATGTLNPVVSVQVSSQISGQIRQIHVDFNSQVKAGQLVAQIAPETYEHRVHQAEADLEAARANVAVQQAEIYRARVNLADAERDHDRKKMLVDKNFISPAEREKAYTVLEAARAQLQVVEAQAKNSAALVKQREAQLGQAQVDLGRTRIVAPVDGIVIKRSVEPGQTVAVSLQAPELFVIARNLTDMQVETAIDEADVGRLKAGQQASFTVDAFPGRSFSGSVQQVRKSAQVVSNVVSYTVVISAANPDLMLLPGMTANVRIVTAQKDDVLKLPNAALRFRPQLDADQKDKERESGAAAGKGPGGSGGKSGKGEKAGKSSGRVWVAGQDGKPVEIRVKTGISDGSMTEMVEVIEGSLAEGAEVIVGQPGAAKAGVPMPRMF
ncbi:MAG: efflux RND transporter periplasmic adaptor subunit [Gammaproteobacteria bacterium]|nr:efflux RND transporter periplasmic adaptor subunit [Gammaproteobacteria bacterium]MBU1647053.1 efflux RND transporter periplasmic adaptor subunit [Gammaproteobacteria bacterium]MBU1972565.1 efflux RND transporter periplasmic adaptor subunit [Gammaproteobacteria bacterium]